jgi:hypothetical protein
LRVRLRMVQFTPPSPEPGIRQGQPICRGHRAIGCVPARWLARTVSLPSSATGCGVWLLNCEHMRVSCRARRPRDRPRDQMRVRQDDMCLRCFTGRALVLRDLGTVGFRSGNCGEDLFPDGKHARTNEWVVHFERGESVFDSICRHCRCQVLVRTCLILWACRTDMVVSGRGASPID